MRCGYAIESLTLGRTTERPPRELEAGSPLADALCRAQRNVTDLGAICAFNHHNDLGLFCMSGETLPALADRALSSECGRPMRDLLAMIAEVAGWSNQRLFARAFPLPALQSSVSAVVRRAWQDADRNAALLARLELADEHRLLVPIGGHLPEPRAIEDRLRRAVEPLSDEARARLTLVNSGPCLVPEQLLRLSVALEAPVALRHPLDLRSNLGALETAWRFFDTWEPRHGVPLVVFGGDLNAGISSTAEQSGEGQRALERFVAEVGEKMPFDLLYDGPRADFGLAPWLARIGALH